MKATKKNIKETVREYMETKNLTAMCRNFRLMGITKRGDIVEAIRSAYTWKYFTHKAGETPTHIAFNLLSGDLDGKRSDLTTSYMNDWEFVRWQKTLERRYLKILIVGDKHIYWASPAYGHSDYNKSVWRENTPENRRKAEIINKFLLK